jgi:hypothetical protein
MRSDTIFGNIPIMYHAIMLLVQQWTPACLTAADQECMTAQSEADVAVSKPAISLRIHPGELQGVQHLPPALKLGTRTAFNWR